MTTSTVYKPCGSATLTSILITHHSLSLEPLWKLMTSGTGKDSQTMRAVVYDKAFEVNVKDVKKPTIEHPEDVIVKITTTCICGSDLHMYEGRTAAEAGMILGHEKCVVVPPFCFRVLIHRSLGIVDQVGSAVTLLKEGDRVVLPFNIGCGRCLNCEEGKTGFCTTVNPGAAGGVYGYVAMGPFSGGQAVGSGQTTDSPILTAPQEYLRVPFADFNALQLPQGSEHEDDFVLLADVWPTGWHGVELSGFKSGESIAVFGAGAVGLMAAYSALLRGASAVYVVDRVPARLHIAQEMGCVPIDFTAGDPADQIVKLRKGKMVDRGVDAVGYQANSHDGKGEQPNAVLDALIRVVRPTGGLGVPGLYLPIAPGSADKNAEHDVTRQNEYRVVTQYITGKFFEKGLSMGSGQCDVKKYNRYLRDLIISGRAKPSFIISHHISLDEAPDAYNKFDKREEGYTKVLIHPSRLRANIPLTVLLQPPMLFISAVLGAIVGANAAAVTSSFIDVGTVRTTAAVISISPLAPAVSSGVITSTAVPSAPTGGYTVLGVYTTCIAVTFDDSAAPAATGGESVASTSTVSGFQTPSLSVLPAPTTTVTGHEITASLVTAPIVSVTASPTTAISSSSTWSTSAVLGNEPVVFTTCLVFLPTATTSAISGSATSSLISVTAVFSTSIELASATTSL
ncbi:unnamed protein product [Mycena citricolor]|uniref:Uncharacterized protein n=1 Tax=Mycena citricolor TaxID=2018698 RepID=A0AAD2H2V4_9AGAR|nr:unnamed protein product [Mycena citricolor]